MAIGKEIGSALVGAGSSLISNIFGSSSQAKANKFNAQQAQLNRDFQSEMMEKQNAWNVAQWERESKYATDMWNKTNEYNSAKNQAARLREAGLNPSIVMSGQNAGTASAQSAPSGNSVGLPSGSAAQGQAYKYDFSSVGNALQTAISLENQSKMNDASARYTNMQADYYGAKTMAEISKLYAETNSHTAKTYYQNLLNKYGDDMLGQQYLNEKQKYFSTEVQIQNAIKQGVLMDEEIAHYDEYMNAQIADLVASTALKYSQKQINKEQLNGIIEDNIGKKLSNEEKRAIFDYVVEKARIASLPQNMFVGAYELGQTASHTLNTYMRKWNNTDWKNIHKRGYPKPW